MTHVRGCRIILHLTGSPCLRQGVAIGSNPEQHGQSLRRTADSSSASCGTLGQHAHKPRSGRIFGHVVGEATEMYESRAAYSQGTAV